MAGPVIALALSKRLSDKLTIYFTVIDINELGLSTKHISGLLKFKIVKMSSNNLQ